MVTTLLEVKQKFTTRYNVDISNQIVIEAIVNEGKRRFKKYRGR